MPEGDVVVRLVDKKVKPIKNVSVEVNQVTQDFLFGTLSEEIFRSGIDSAQGKKFKTLFTRLKRLIKEGSMTNNVRMTTTKHGEVMFRGFYGMYSLRVITADGKDRFFDFHLAEDKNSNEVVLIVK